MHLPDTTAASSLAQTRRSPGTVPYEAMQLVRPAALVGALTGTAGAFAGTITAVARGLPAGLYSVVAGAQCFVLGSGYWLSRSALLGAYGVQDPQSRKYLIGISSFAGGTAGLLGGALRGPKNIVPGIVMFGLYGAVGQTAVNVWHHFRASPRKEKAATPEKSSWMQSKWSPVKKLTDDEYIAILNERVLKLDVEISLIDDRIAVLRQPPSEVLSDQAEKPKSSP